MIIPKEQNSLLIDTHPKLNQTPRRKILQLQKKQERYNNKQNDKLQHSILYRNEAHKSVQAIDHQAGSRCPLSPSNFHSNVLPKEKDATLRASSKLLSTQPVATTKSDKLSQENRPNISPISRKFQHKPSIKVNQSDTSSTSTVSGNNLQPNTKSKVTKKSSTCPHCGVAYVFRSGLAKHVRKARSNEGQKEAKGYITCHLCRSR